MSAPMDGKATAPGRPPVPADLARRDVAEQILHHFHENARAMDSAEGIARFWLNEAPETVQGCLEDLSARGLLEKRTIGGTDFFSLPRRPLPTGIPGSARAQAEPGSSAAGRVLVVDDDPGVLQLLVDILAGAGHAVTPAESGPDALRLFRASPFDLVLTDVVMPGLSGLEVLREVKEAAPDTEVIVITAHSSLELALRALRHGAYDFITKPLEDLELFTRVVGRALEKCRLATENRLLLGSLQGRNGELREAVARLAAINEIGRATLGALEPDELYRSLARLAAQHLKAGRVSVLLSEPGSDTMTVVASVGVGGEQALHRRVRLGEGIAGRVAAARAPLLVPDIDKSDLRNLATPGRYSTPSFLIAPLVVTHPTRAEPTRIGAITASDKHSGDPFSGQDQEFLCTLAYQASAAIARAHVAREVESGYVGALAGLIQAAEDATPATRGHSRRVTELSARVARELGIPEPRVEILTRAAALHEVGRLAGGAAARRGRGRRSAASRGWNADAVTACERILAGIPSLREVREVIFHATDRAPGAPGPLGAERASAPVEASILAICEELDLLVAGEGQDPVRLRAALETLRRRASRSPDAGIVEALGRVVERGGAA